MFEEDSGRYPERGITTTYRLGAALRRLRRERGLTQQELAERAGISRPWVCRMESGKHNEGVGTVLRVLSALDCDMTLAPIDRSGFNLDDYLTTFDHND